MLLCAFLCALQAWSHWHAGHPGLAITMACCSAYILGMWTVFAVRDFVSWKNGLLK